jgi:hypothetical protein
MIVPAEIGDDFLCYFADTCEKQKITAMRLEEHKLNHETNTQRFILFRTLSKEKGMDYKNEKEVICHTGDDTSGGHLDGLCQ